MIYNPYGINQEDPSVMWIDLNSAFATAEQQAHPSLRGKPMGVTNRLSKECCVIAASYEAKALGIKVGCRRTEALAKCPDFIMLETDPPKYHHVYERLLHIMKDYTHKVKMKSIDEGILDFHNTRLQGRTKELVRIGYEIKDRVRKEIGDYMKINVGIAPNRFLAKTAAGLHKPDGLDVIDHTNLIEIYESLDLQDLTGIAEGYGSRLRAHGIFTPIQFLQAQESLLKRQVFRSINGHYWYQRLRGFEIDDYQTKLGMVGRQWVVKKPTHEDTYLRSCLHYLAETTGMKLRYRNMEARGVCVWLSFVAGGGFVDKKMYKVACYSNNDIWERVSSLFDKRPKHMAVRTMGLYLYQLEPSSRSQMDLFGLEERKSFLTQAIDEINDFYGTFTVYSADTLEGTKNVKQKIPFGGTEYFDLLLKRK
jgi:DNA polymerase IV